MRTRTGLQLTEAGLLLQERAGELLTMADKTLHDLKDESTELSGHLAVGMGLLHGAARLCRALSEFTARHPKVSFEVRTATADLIMLQLRAAPLMPGCCSRRWKPSFLIPLSWTITRSSFCC